MCVEKVQKILLALALGIVMMLTASGSVKAAFLLQFAIMVILIANAFTGFCSLTKVLNSAFPMCDEETK